MKEREVEGLHVDVREAGALWKFRPVRDPADISWKETRLSISQGYMLPGLLPATLPNASAQ